jgi:hypothetical protein
MSLTWTVAAVAATALLLLLTERAVPLRNQRLAWLPELALNVALSALAFGVSAVLVRPAVVRAMGWSHRHDFGLVYLLDLPDVAACLLERRSQEPPLILGHGPLETAIRKLGYFAGFFLLLSGAPGLQTLEGFRFGRGSPLIFRRRPSGRLLLRLQQP